MGVSYLPGDDGWILLVRGQNTPRDSYVFKIGICPDMSITNCIGMIYYRTSSCEAAIAPPQERSKGDADLTSARNANN